MACKLTVALITQHNSDCKFLASQLSQFADQMENEQRQHNTAAIERMSRFCKELMGTEVSVKA